MILITGASGQLGQAVTERCKERSIPFMATERKSLDIADRETVSSLLSGHFFDCIVNCAAYTAVDAAEDHPSDAYKANAYAPWLLASHGIPIIHVSTDYVFEGNASEPYEVYAPARPLSVYGLSKRSGEIALMEGGFKGIIVRTAWLYSKMPGTKNFFQTISRLARERDVLRVVNDQFGAPTRTDDLAEALVSLYEQGAHLKSMQILHLTNAGQCSWFEFAKAIAEFQGLATPVLPIPSSEYPTKAVRPHYSVLSLHALSAWGIHPRHWLDALTAD